MSAIMKMIAVVTAMPHYGRGFTVAPSQVKVVRKAMDRRWRLQLDDIIGTDILQACDTEGNEIVVATEY